MTSFVKRERNSICQNLRYLGPDKPTLCHGWSTKDLLVHLVVRENRPDAAAGLVVPFLKSYTDSIYKKFNEKGFEDLITIFENGPKSPSPFTVAAVDQLANTFEFLVHNEDILRAQPNYSPREFSEEDLNFLWSRFTKSAIFFMRRVKVGVVAKTEQGIYTLKRGEESVTISGNLIDLIMFSFGRKENTSLQFEGNLQAIEKLKNSNLNV